MRESREIPLHPKQSSEGPEQEEETDAPTPAPADGQAAGDEGSRPDAPSPAMSSSLKNKEESDGENPTIQIPKVTSVASGLTLPPNLAELAANLEGKYVDEFGNVLDWDGRVLGRVEGDLPSMIGRPVAATGEVLSEDDEVVGYVAENETIQPAVPPPRPIHGMGNGLKVDHLGNILDQDDNVVGHFNSDHMGKALEQKEQAGQSGTTNSQDQGDAGQQGSDARSRNPKPTAAPSPSEIYLDVKSTNDGVQLIIKIPTVFNGGGGPNIHISSGS